MSVNTLPPQEGLSPFALLEGEIIRYQTSTVRQSLSLELQSPKSDITVHIKVSDGSVYLTNQRIIFVTASQGDVSSFVIESSRLRALRFDHSLESPWFGPNYWRFRFYSPPDGSCNGFPKGEYFNGKIVFKDGGIFDFTAIVDDIINDSFNNSHIDEELPRYTERV